MRIMMSNPASGLTARIARLREEEAALEQRVGSLLDQAAVSSRALAEVKRLSKMAPALENLAAFLDGKITHFAVDLYGSIMVQERTQALEETEQYRHGQQRLLTLFGDTKGNLTWNLNHYSDGSGHKYTAVPCTSEDEALKVACGLCNHQIAEARKDGLHWRLEDIEKSCKRLGMVFPADLDAKLRESRKAHAEQKVAEAEKLLAVARAELAKAEA